VMQNSANGGFQQAFASDASTIQLHVYESCLLSLSAALPVRCRALHRRATMAYACTSTSTDLSCCLLCCGSLNLCLWMQCCWCIPYLC